MKTSQLFLLALLGAALSRPAQAQTTTPTPPPGTPIDAANPTAAPAPAGSTVVPGQPGTPPPVATPPGAVYPPAAGPAAPHKKTMPKLKQRHPARPSRPTARP